MLLVLIKRPKWEIIAELRVLQRICCLQKRIITKRGTGVNRKRA